MGTTDRVMHQKVPLVSLKPPLIEKIRFIGKDVATCDHSGRFNDYVYSTNSLNIHPKKDRLNFWIEGYGCSANFSDLEMIAGKLQQDGYNLVDNPALADINLIVTCSVKMPTEHKMIDRIKILSNSNTPLIIAGCLPAADEKMVTTLSPNASLMGPNSIQSVSELAEAALNGRSQRKIENTNFYKVNLPKININPIISIVQIATGCLSECTFCQTKLAKGSLKSFRIGDIVNQINSDLENGSKEIWLTSTDNGCYGIDIGTNLINLLNSCESIDKYFKIRLGMMNPMYLTNLDRNIGDLLKCSNKLFKFIHIPIQSGSKSILKKMKRGHSINPLLEIVDNLKNEVPNITIATDIITGFPTETDDDFEDTLKAINHLQPDIVNSSKFSPRPGTSAAKMPKVKDEIISSRSERLHHLVKKIAMTNATRWSGWKGEVLINDIENGKLKGRNDFYKSIILIDDPHSILRETTDNLALFEKDASQPSGQIIQQNIFNKNKVLSLNPNMGLRIIVKVVSHSNHTLNAIPLEIVRV